jgi:hypothetical protein
MKKFISLVVVSMLSAVWAFAAVDPAGNLTGAWRITMQDGAQAEIYDVVLIKTNLTVDNGDGTTSPYYIAQAEGLFKMGNVVGASTHKNSKGKFVINWRRFRSLDDKGEFLAGKKGGRDKGMNLDIEDMVILEVQGDTLVLGADSTGTTEMFTGDKTKQRAARMTKRPLTLVSERYKR